MEKRMKKLSFMLAMLVGFSSYTLSNTVEDYKKACLKQDAQGCLNLGLAYAKGIETERDYESAKNFLDIACDLGNTQACAELKDADQHRNDSGIGASGTEQDNRIVVFRKACDRGDGDACSRLGSYYEDGKRVKRNYAKAEEYYQKACDFGESIGCVILGQLYEEGKKLKHNDVKAEEYYKKACTLGESAGCFLLGIIYMDNSRTKAKKYFKKACDLGDDMGCTEYKKMIND